MSPAKLAAVRSTTVVKPAVRSSAGRRTLERSLRRLGADEQTVALLDADRGRPEPLRTS